MSSNVKSVYTASYPLFLISLIKNKIQQTLPIIATCQSLRLSTELFLQLNRDQIKQIYL